MNVTIAVEDVVPEFLREVCASSLNGVLETLIEPSRQLFSIHHTIQSAFSNQDVVAF